MRQIYTSPRMENIQRVIALLAERHVETTLTQRRAYQGSNWQRFSYSERNNRDTWPQVWVVRAEDQTRARAVLREAGLEPATRFADELALSRIPTDPRHHHVLSMRLRLVLLALIAGIALLIFLTQSAS